MGRPSTRTEFIDYCKRQLGAPVLEINVADEQIEDIVDDAIQYFQERHFDGVAQTYMKYKVTQDDIDRGKGPGSTGVVGLTTSSATADIAGTETQFDYEENSNYLAIPPEIIGITKIFHFDGSNTITNNMFSVKYQLFLNDIYYWGATELLTYAMTKTYLEDINFLLTTEKQIRFNQRQDRLYLDIDWGAEEAGTYLVLDCYRALDPEAFKQIYNDSFVKPYVTALIKKQWGQNLIKFKGTKLPGGIELNGREIYDDAERELEDLRSKMTTEYELPPYDFIG